jgi:hypothetical protein
MPIAPQYIHLPDGPVTGPLHLLPVNADVLAVHTADGAHVGSLKRIGAVWKFKAMGYDASGAMEPGGGPLTERHNMAFAEADAAEVTARLLHL